MTENKEKEVCEEPDMTSIGSRCEQCQHYLFIDSGYGYCRRFPPKVENTGKWWKLKWEIKYPLVEWCRISCGEFKNRL